MNIRALMLTSAVVLISQFSLAQAAIINVEGVIDKVVPEKTEIYVLADGKRHEFYFSKKTEISRAGQPVAFEMLKKAMKVKVTADKIGRRLDPLKVEILE